jgi:type IV secretory pathway component VirB8
MEDKPDKKEEIIKRNAIIVTIITAIIAIGILVLVLFNRITNGS